jgi:cytochrome b involved in lipid metabolism
MIVDISEYMNHHPGGKQYLSSNIGRDISKFFYGGYKLQNNTWSSPHTHSNISKRIVNDLIIGRLQSDE